MTQPTPLHDSNFYEFEGFSIYYAKASSKCWPQEAHREVEVAIPLGLPTTEPDRSTAQIYIIPEQHPHRLPAVESGELLIIYLVPQFILNSIHEILLKPDWKLPRLYILEDSFIQFIAKTLRTWLPIESATATLHRNTLIKLLITHLTANYAQATLKSSNQALPPHEKIVPVLSHIQAHLDWNLKVANLADMAGFSLPYFCQVFKQSMGLAPYQYILSARIDQSKKLLLGSDLTVCEIALSCGFYDQSHFISQFRRFIGTTPKAYRDSEQKSPAIVKEQQRGFRNEF